jgi:hypothetical protein
VGDLFLPETLNGVRWRVLGVKMEMQVNLVLRIHPFLFSVIFMFLWRSGEILGSIFFSSLKQRKQFRAFVSSGREMGEEFHYLFVCIRLEGAKASVA